MNLFNPSRPTVSEVDSSSFEIEFVHCSVQAHIQLIKKKKKKKKKKKYNTHTMRTILCNQCVHIFHRLNVQ